MAENDKKSTFAQAWNISGRSCQTGDVHGTEDLAVSARTDETPMKKTQPGWGYPGNGPE